MTGMSNVTKLAGEPSGQEFLVFTLGDEATIRLRVLPIRQPLLKV